VVASPAPKAILVGAHPDDETIGAGILMTLLPDISLVQVTDGAPRNTPMVKKLGLSSLAEYAELRRAETVRALEAAGVQAGSFTTIGIADQEAVNNIGLITGKMIELLPVHDLVITHAYEGAHPDHDATALAVHAACWILRQSRRPAPDIVEMTGYHFSGGQEVFGRFIEHPDAGPVETLELSPAQRDTKRRMFECYRTQTGVLKDFTIGTESFRQAPRYDFLRPPHPGTLFYERHGWKITGRSWRDEAGRALRSLDLLSRL
jgi:LmbE family N-acetylglucosaminyl deacetylase